mgnify:CR=1 FL=1
MLSAFRSTTPGRSPKSSGRGTNRSGGFPLWRRSLGEFALRLLDFSFSVGARWQNAAVRAVTDREIARIPVGNLRVSRAVFSQLWREVEACAAAETAREASTPRTAGLVLSCRWIACSTTEVNGRHFPAVRPIGRGAPIAYPELIEAEYVAAETAAAGGQGAARFASKPDYVESVCAVLRWAWRRNGPRPVVDFDTGSVAG